MRIISFSFFLFWPLLTMAAPTAGTVSVQGEVLVKLKSDKNWDAFWQSQEKNSFALEKVRTLSTLSGNIFVVRSQAKNKKMDSNLVDQMIKEIKKSPYVQIVEPNYIYSIGNPQREGNYTHSDKANIADDTDGDLDAPTDPLFPKLWGLHNVGQADPTLLGVAGIDIAALKAWEITKGSKEIKVAVVDTGIDYTHPDLADNMLVNEAEKQGKVGVDDDQNGFVDDIYGYDFANHDSDPMDGHNHGTHCAGTIGAIHNNNIGVAGVMGDVSLVAVKFLSDSGQGTTDGAIEAIDYATKRGVDIMSNSWGGGGYSELLKESIVRAKDKGIIFVAAAGNSSQNNDERPNYPSNYQVDNVIGVAAHTSDDQLASFSSFGPRTVHVAAPGKSILSTVKGDRYAVYSGTSMSTPHVAGTIGLLLSKVGRMGFSELKERLLLTSTPDRVLKRKVLARGRLNAYNLLTNTRPERNEPDPKLWKKKTLDQALESRHPYGDNESMKKMISVPGAKYVRVIVKKFELERQYDFLRLRNPATKEMVEEISGEGANYTTEYVDGERLELELTSDHSVTQWGFAIEAIEYINN